MLLFAYQNQKMVKQTSKSSRLVIVFEQNAIENAIFKFKVERVTTIIMLYYHIDYYIIMLYMCARTRQNIQSSLHVE